MSDGDEETVHVDLAGTVVEHRLQAQPGDAGIVAQHLVDDVVPHRDDLAGLDLGLQLVLHDLLRAQGVAAMHEVDLTRDRSEEHTSELQSLMRISYAVFCLKKNTISRQKKKTNT